MMSEEEYQELIELMKQKTAELMTIESRYILEDGNLIEIVEMPPEVLRGHFEVKKLGDCPVLKLDRNIDVSRELGMLMKANLKNLFKEILGNDHN